MGNKTTPKRKYSVVVMDQNWTMVEDATSFTGWRWCALAVERGVDGNLGMPATIFEVAMWNYVHKLREENAALNSVISVLKSLDRDKDVNT